MATFYVGKRPVLRGRRASEFANPLRTTKMTGTRSAVGTYTQHTLFGPGLLTGAPDNNHTPGTGYSPHDVSMTRRYRGLDTKNPMDDAGSGARLSYHRYIPDLFRGVPGAAALGTGLGHLPRRGKYYQLYDNSAFDGVGAAPLASSGHVRRYVSKVTSPTGAANSFGAFDPWVYKGVTTRPLSGGGQTVPVGYANPYGRNRVAEWHGVPASRAL